MITTKKAATGKGSGSAASDGTPGGPQARQHSHGSELPA